MQLLHFGDKQSMVLLKRNMMIDFVNQIPKDPNYEPQFEQQDLNCRFIGKTCRFRAMINETLLKEIKEELNDHLF